MARFNTNVGKVNRTPNTQNLAGGDAFVESTKLELASLVLTSFLKDKFYESGKDQLERLKALIKGNDPLFAAKLAVFARNEFGMRSVSHVIAAEIAATVKGQEWTKNFINSVIHRPDDMTEIMAYHIAKNGKPVPSCLKKGLRAAFNKFSTYQLAKYRAEGAEVSLVDLANLVHPVPTDKNREALAKLIKGELKSFDTWESGLTEAGQTAENEEEKTELKKGVWAKLISENKIGYFALLRNLRNIAQQAPESLDAALNLLVNAEAIKKSMVLPFRFTTAYKTIQAAGLDSSVQRKIQVAIDKAVTIAVDNVPTFDGRTLIAVDISGSMMGKPIDIGSIFAAALYKRNQDADIMLFNTTARYHVPNPTDSLMTIANGIVSSVSGGTNFNSIFDSMTKKYDRVIIISDMQAWMTGGYFSSAPIEAAKKYRARHNADPMIFSFDINGYGTLQFPEAKVCAVTGWSEKCLDLIKALENGDRQALVHKIEQVQL